MLALMLAAVTWFIAWRNGYPKMPRATLKQQWTAFRESVWGLLLIVLVLGGIYGGIFTPTEAAAVAAMYAFFITVFIYKELKLAEVGRVLLQAASMSSMLLYIITNAVLFSFLMTHEQIPQEMAAWIIDKNFGLWTFLLVVNIMLLAAGNVMDPSSILLIMAPILFPLATKIGIHPVHLGVLMIVNTEVGLCHPPVGPQSLHRQRDREDGHQRNHHRGAAVAVRDADLPRPDHLHPRDFAVAAAASWE